MKTLLITTILALTIPLAVGAQQMDPGQMQQILQQAQTQSGGRVKINTTTIMAVLGMHQCMQDKIGDDGIKRLGDWGTALNKQVKPLCAAGKRDEAMAAQMNYAKSVMKTPEYAGVKACADQYKGLLSDPSFSEIRAVVENPAQTDKHVCDYIKS